MQRKSQIVMKLLILTIILLVDIVKYILTVRCISTADRKQPNNTRNIRRPKLLLWEFKCFRNSRSSLKGCNLRKITPKLLPSRLLHSIDAYLQPAMMSIRTDHMLDLQEEGTCLVKFSHLQLLCIFCMVMYPVIPHWKKL